MRFASIRDGLPLPVKLFPVYQLFLAVFCGCRKTLVLGFMSPLSRVGQRPQSLYLRVWQFRFAALLLLSFPALEQQGFSEVHDDTFPECVKAILWVSVITRFSLV